MFNNARIMATESFQAVEKEIQAETESWSQNQESAMTILRQKIETTTEEAKKVAEDAFKRETEAAKELLKKEEQEKLKTEAVLLDVTISAGQKKSPLTLIVEERSGKEVKRFSDVKPGQTVPISLPPDPYILRLLGPNNEEITAKSKRLAPAKDETLII